jgi:hypothetical protein
MWYDLVCCADDDGFPLQLKNAGDKEDKKKKKRRS